MPPAPRPVVCTVCFARRELAPIGRNFFPGNPRYRCSRCGTAFLQPLSTVSAVVGWVMCAAFATSWVLASLGRTDLGRLDQAIAAGFAAILLLGLLRDVMVRNTAAAAQRAHDRGEGGARE
jgi:hypothetical protein